MKKNLPFFSFSVLMVVGSLYLGCSTAQREKRRELRDKFSMGNYQEGLALLESSDLKEEKSRLLYYLEKGLIHHTQGNYFLSLQALEKAKETSQQLYTTSISKKVLTTMANDTVDLYYGKNFERSLIHFYLSLNHFMLWQKGEYEAYSPKDVGLEGKEGEIIPARPLDAKDKLRELAAARAELLAWDSVLQGSKDERRGQSVFKDDMLAKVYGAFIHEAYGTPNDEQVALQLYKDAKDLLFKNYNAYRTFNNKSVQFKKDYSKFPHMDMEKVKSEYVEPTPYQKDLVDFLDYKILSLTQKSRPAEMKRVIDQIKPTAETVARVQKEGKEGQNVGIVIQLGMIPEKVPDKYNIGIEGAVNQAEDEKTKQAIMSVGVPILAAFAAETLGLVPDANNWSTPGAVLGVGAAHVAVSTVGISFELPKVVNEPTQERVFLEVYDQAGKIIRENPLVLLNPLGDIAEEAIAEDAAWSYTRTGVRVALKHITAILAAYSTYKLMANSGNQMSALFAKSAAVLEYVAASKVIEASEKADVRYWSTLPKDFRTTHLYLPAGEYQLKAKILGPDGNGGEGTRVFDLGGLKVVDDKKKQLVNFRIKNKGTQAL